MVTYARWKQHIPVATWAVLAVSLLLSSAAHAQRLLIESATLSATREAGQTYVHSAMFPSVPGMAPSSLPGPVLLPGETRLGPLLLSSDQRHAFAATRSRQPSNPHFLTAMVSSPFEALPGLDYLVPAGWQVDATAHLTVAGTGQRFLIIAESSLPALGREAARLRVMPLIPGERFNDLAIREHPLPGRAVAIANLPAVGTVAALCVPDPSTRAVGVPAVVHLRDIFSGRILTDDIPLTGGAGDLVNPRPVALGRSADGSHLFMLLAAEALRDGATRSVTLVHALDTALPQDPLTPVEVPGVSDQASIASLTSDEESIGPPTAWLVTHSPRVRFGHLIRVIIQGETLTIAVQQPLSGAVESPRLALVPGAEPVPVVAVGNRVDLWPDGYPTGGARIFEAPVRAVAAVPGRVFVGEGNRIHALALPALAPVGMVALDTDAVEAIVPIPGAGPLDDGDGDGLTRAEERARGTNPRLADTSGDGIHDGVDPNPTAMTPRLSVPRLVVLPSESIGTEVRAVPITTAVDGDALRLVEVDTAEAPWLLAAPLSWRGPGSVYLGVDRAWFGAFQEPAEGRLVVRLIDPLTNRDAYGSPAEITVRVLPTRDPVRRILWLVQGVDSVSALRASQGAALGVLASRLAGPPHLFSHEVKRTALDALEPYSILIVDGAAAARGALLRQNLLDFVSNGGAVLFLAGPLDGDAARNAARWLQPFGIRVTGGDPLQGAFASHGDHPLAAAWQAFPVRAGGRIEAVPPAEVIVPVPEDEGAVVLAAVEYGRGRVVVMASDEPLRDGVMLRVDHRRFGDILFSWLADTRSAPVRSVIDSADSHTPRPSDDAPARVAITLIEGPVIEAVEPETGPGEGGTPVVITGRNLDASHEVFFGEARARTVQPLGPGALRVETPASDQRAVAVRVHDPATGRASTLADAFRFGPRTALTFSLRALGLAREVYTETLSLILEEPGAPVGLMAVRLRAELGGEGIIWGPALTGAAARHANRSVTGQVDGANDLFITIGEASPGRAAVGGQLAVIPLRLPENLSSPVTVAIDWSRIVAPNGEPLEALRTEVVLTP